MRVVPLLLVALAAHLSGVPPATPAGAQTMAGGLGSPVTVPLDFLVRIDRDEAWLAEAMARLGVAGQFDVAKGRLLARTVDALRAANRIRAFASLAAMSLGPPYIDLTVDAGKGPVRCPTLFATEIVPNLTAMDFAQQVLPAEKADPTLLKLCTPDPARTADYAALDRSTLRERYFDQAGDLRPEFAGLNSDAALVARALDLGFYVTQGDLTGRLKLGAE